MACISSGDGDVGAHLGDVVGVEVEHVELAELVDVADRLQAAGRQVGWGGASRCQITAR